MTILNRVKIYVECENTTDFDDQLLLLINQSLSTLALAGVPVELIDEDTTRLEELDVISEETALSYVCLRVLREFDKNMSDASVTTQAWIDKSLLSKLSDLKAKFDRGGV